MVVIHARLRTPPCTFVAHAVCPGSNNPHGVGLCVYQNTGVAHAVLRFGQPASFAKGHGEAHWLPRTTAIRAAAKPNIDVFLQVYAVVMAYIVHAEQCSAIGSNQSGDAIGGHPIVAGMPNADAHTAKWCRLAHVFNRQGPVIAQSLAQSDVESGVQGGCGLHFDAHPKEVVAGEKLLFATQGNSGLRGLHLVLFHRVRRNGLHCSSWGEVGDVLHGFHTAFAVVLPGICAAVIQL